MYEELDFYSTFLNSWAALKLPSYNDGMKWMPIVIVAFIILQACSSMGRAPTSVKGAADLYKYSLSGQAHQRLIEDYLQQNKNQPELAEKIRATYRPECTLSARLARGDKSVDIERFDIESIRNSTDPFDPGVSLNALADSTELMRLKDSTGLHCAEALRRSLIALSADAAAAYFSDVDSNRYYYIANFSEFDLERAQAFLQRHKEQIAARSRHIPSKNDDTLSPMQRARIEFLDRRGSEQFYIARVPKHVSDMLAEDVHMSNLPVPLFEKPVTHLQMRVYFDEPVVLVPQRITALGSIGPARQLDSLLFTTEANGLPGFAYDVGSQVAKDVRVDGIDWKQGTYLNFYRFKSLSASIRDSFPYAPEKTRKEFPLTQYALSMPSQKAKDLFLLNSIQLAQKNGSHLPYFLLSNNCAVGVFAALDDALGTSPQIREQKTPVTGKLLISIPWEEHNAFRLRGLLPKEPDTFSTEQIRLTSRAVASTPTQGVQDYCQLFARHPGYIDIGTGKDDAMGICRSFGY